MKNIGRIDHINMSIRNFKESIKFYSDVFGLKVVEEGVSPYSGNEYKIIGRPESFFLCLYESNSEFNDNRVGHIGVHVAEFDKFIEHLKEHNVEIKDYGILEYPKSRSLYIEDPNGFEIEISESFGAGLE